MRYTFPVQLTSPDILIKLNIPENYPNFDFLFMLDILETSHKATPLSVTLSNINHVCLRYNF